MYSDLKNILNDSYYSMLFPSQVSKNPSQVSKNQSNKTNNTSSNAS